MNFDINEEKIQMEKEGNIVECDVLFKFDSEDTMKCYIAYTDHSIGKNGRKNIYISSYDPLKSTLELEDITDSKELEMINDFLQEIDKEVNG